MTPAIVALNLTTCAVMLALAWRQDRRSREAHRSFEHLADSIAQHEAERAGGAR